MLMDNNNFEQQFTQNLRAMPPQPAMPSSNSGSKLPLIIAIILAVVVLFESIVLLIALVNNSSTSKVAEEETYEEGEDDEYDIPSEELEEYYQYDDEDNLTAFKETCRNTDGSYYAFTTDNKYQYYDSSSSLASSGTYSIARDTVVTLNGTNDQNKILYYGTIFIADGNTFYDCDELTNNSNE